MTASRNTPPRRNRTVLGAALLALALGPAAAASGAASSASPTGPHPAAGTEAAAAACLAHPNEFGPMRVAEAVEDGVGDSLVWLSDRDGDLWACNAGADGAVFAYVVVGPDLLQGAGAPLVRDVADGLDSDPLAGAAALCLMIPGEGAELVSYVDDGYGDALAWVRLGEETFMCNASAEGALYAFEAVGTPVNGESGGANVAGGSGGGVSGTVPLVGTVTFGWGV